jgi:tellurite resistance protein
MFLHLLVDKEKEAFIDLARLAAGCNNDITDEQEIMLEQYCDEMGISFPMSHAKSLDEIIDFFKESSYQNRKMVVFEIIGLLFSDGNFDENEMAFVKKMAIALGVSKETVEEMFELNTRYLAILHDILCIIQDENS